MREVLTRTSRVRVSIITEGVSKTPCVSGELRLSDMDGIVQTCVL